MAEYLFTINSGADWAEIDFVGPGATESTADYAIYEASTDNKVYSGYVENLDPLYVNIYLEADGLSPDTEYRVEIMYDSELYEEKFTTLPSSPLPFEWSIEKVSGEEIRVSAAEWNAFLDHINAVRVYCGLAEATFKKVIAHKLTGRNVVTRAEIDAGNVDKKSLISYENIREAVDAIVGKDGKYTGIGISDNFVELIDIQKGDRLSANFFNNLRDAVNSVLE